jgi:tryptophan synthase alpha chain
VTRRIPAMWNRLRDSGQCALVPFITAGFPRLDSTTQAIKAAADAGADMIEIGVPFSDPLADGPAIQRSSQVALHNGVDLRWILALVESSRRHFGIPIVLMGYYNPFLQYGLRGFCRDAAGVGVDGLIVPDLPPDEAGAFKSEAESAGLSMVFLIAPTTKNARVRAIGQASTDFCYCVSVTGVTGARAAVEQRTEDYLARVKRLIPKPIVVGFGVSEPGHVNRLKRCADGVVVGSALVPLIEASAQNGSFASLRKSLASLVAAAHTPERSEAITSP